MSDSLEIGSIRPAFATAYTLYGTSFARRKVATDGVVTYSEAARRPSL